MGVNITTIDYLRVLIIEIGSTIILMVVEAQGSFEQNSCRFPVPMASFLFRELQLWWPPRLRWTTSVAWECQPIKQTVFNDHCGGFVVYNMKNSSFGFNNCYNNAIIRKRPNIQGP